MLGHVSAKSVGVRSTSNHCDESKGSKLLMMYVISRSERILLDASKWQIRSSKSSRHMQVDVWACALLCGGSKGNAELRGLLDLTLPMFGGRLYDSIAYIYAATRKRG